MKTKISLSAALTIACLTSGCVVPAYYGGSPGYYDGPVEYGRPVEYAPPPPSEGVFVPEVIVVEGGVRHDRYFYERHPEYYHRDRMRYPERFSHAPPSYRGHVPPPYAAPGRPQQAPHEDSKEKKKKKHHDDDH